MEFPDLELERLKRDLAECKAKLEKYEVILKDNDLLESIPEISDTEFVCRNQIAKYRLAVEKGAILELNEVKVLDLLVKNLLLAQGKAAPVAEKKKEEGKADIGKLLALAGGKNDED